MKGCVKASTETEQIDTKGKHAYISDFGNERGRRGTDKVVIHTIDFSSSVLLACIFASKRKSPFITW